MRTYAAVIIISTIGAVATLEDNAYGPFELQIQSVTSCKGMRRRNCANMEHELLPGGGVAARVRVHEDVRVDAARFTITKTGKANSAPLISMELKRPCQQLFIGHFINLITKDHSCLFRKGTYRVETEISEISKLTQRFWGGNFFYGNVTVKAALFNDKCNFACTLFDMTFIPKLCV